MKDHQKEALAAAVKATGLDEKAVDSMYGLYDFSMEITPGTKPQCRGHLP